MISELSLSMQTTHARTDYVGALLPDEARLMLVPIQPGEPWEAFRQLRRVLRRQHKDNAVVAMYETESPIEHTADVISIESRRRAG